MFRSGVAATEFLKICSLTKRRERRCATDEDRVDSLCVKKCSNQLQESAKDSRDLNELDDDDILMSFSDKLYYQRNTKTEMCQ